MFWLIKKVFIASLTSIVSASNHPKCICMTQITLTVLDPNKYGERLRYYPFAFNLERYVACCNTLNSYNS